MIIDKLEDDPALALGQVYRQYNKYGAMTWHKSKATGAVQVGLIGEACSLLEGNFRGRQTRAAIESLYDYAAAKDIQSVAVPLGFYLALDEMGLFASSMADNPSNLADTSKWLRHPGVLTALQSVYEIPTTYVVERAVLHRIGTTSFILECRTVDDGINRPTRVAIKCLLPRYFNSRQIAAKTESYKQDHSLSHANTPHVYRSAARFIVMQFIEGETLAESIKRRAQRGVSVGAPAIDGDPLPDRALTEVDITFLRTILLKLICLLRDLHLQGHLHMDLNPNNIIVQQSGQNDIELYLIDFGHNFAITEYPGSSPAFRKAALYVAPELLESDPTIEDWRCDAYSLGLMALELASKTSIRQEDVLQELVRLWGGDERWDGAPGLARIIEELIDRDPTKRLVLRGDAFSDRPYEYLERLVRQETDALAVFERESGSTGLGVLRIRGLLSFAGSAQLQNIVRAPEHIADPVDDSYASYPLLGRWARASYFCWYFSLLSFAGLTLADFGWRDYSNVAEQLLALLHSPSDVARSVTDPRFRTNLVERLVAFTFAITTVTYYINNYSVLSPCQAGRFLWTQRTMRLTAVGMTFFILGALVWDPSRWALWGGVGSLLVVANNYLTLRLSRIAIERGAIFSTRQGRESRRFVREIYKEWWKLMGFYSAILIAYGLSVEFGLTRPSALLALVASLINMGKMYRLNCTETSPQVRGSLSRDILTLKRVARYENRLTSQPTPRQHTDLSDH